MFNLGHNFGLNIGHTLPCDFKLVFWGLICDLFWGKFLFNLGVVDYLGLAFLNLWGKIEVFFGGTLNSMSPNLSRSINPNN